MIQAYTCNFNLDDCLKGLGLDEKGRVQKAVNHEVMRVCDPYVPFDIAGIYEDPGYLKDSVHVDSDGEGVVYDGPYARNLYYHPEYSFQGAPMRGAYWADRAMNGGGIERVEEAAGRAVK